MSREMLSTRLLSYINLPQNSLYHDFSILTPEVS